MGESVPIVASRVPFNKPYIGGPYLRLAIASLRCHLNGVEATVLHVEFLTIPGYLFLYSLPAAA